MLRNKVKPEKKRYAKELRKNPTQAESEIWKFLRKSQLGVKFTRQNIIRGYIVDFYSPASHVVVEVDGSSHDDRRGYDARRDKALSAIGIVTLRFKNEDVFDRTDKVMSEIRSVVTRQIAEGVKRFHGEWPLKNITWRED